MKKILFAFLSLATVFAFTACNDEDDDFSEINLGKQIEEASVTYTVPIYRPSLEWLDYIVSYTTPDGIISTDTISYENVISGKVSLMTLAEKEPTDRKDGRAFWVRNEHFIAIPDSCGINARMSLRSDVNMPDRIDLIVPKPAMTTVVRYTDGNLRSIIGEGLDCNVVSVGTETDLFKSIIEREYFSTCTYYPSVQIYSGSK